MTSETKIFFSTFNKSLKDEIFDNAHLKMYVTKVPAVVIATPTRSTWQWFHCLGDAQHATHWRPSLDILSSRQRGTRNVAAVSLLSLSYRLYGHFNSMHLRQTKMSQHRSS